ncbi:IclR family transcriptional regulator [Azotobacter vinelandii]|uniref:IclR family transcriptional regulator n=1 Tax=Azotobacter vinelandii TaxID=354 RepID=UPI002664F417|nr:IclR family transcriptional regulator [Azotobacter vinelandii]WKN24619.1 IclR family transcriptional regulator [Azotobacter vinelandii]
MTREAPESGEEGKVGGIQVIARAAAIMRTLGEHPQGLSLAAIAQAVKLPRSTVQRIVCALEAEYLVEAMGPSGGFRLGVAVGQLVYQTQTDIISLVRPYLECLSNWLQESVSLSKQAGEKIQVIDRIVAERDLRVVFPIGVFAPMHSTSAGKVLLAGLDDAAVRDLLPDPLPQMTRNTRDLPALLAELAELAEIRETGFTFDHGECSEGISGGSVSLDTYLGRYAISVVLPTARAARRVEAIREALLACKRDIERAIGGTACRR